MKGMCLVALSSVKHLTEDFLYSTCEVDMMI